MSRTIYFGIAFLLIYALGMVAPAHAQETTHPHAPQTQSDVPDPLQAPASTVEAIIDYEGFRLELTNVEFDATRQEFRVTNVSTGGTVEILESPADRRITSFTAIDWDTVIDPAQRTVATFTHENGSTWTLSTYTPDNGRRTILAGDSSAPDLLILDGAGNPAIAAFDALRTIFIKPGIHSNGGRLDSTWFAIGTGEVPQVPVCHNLSLNISEVPQEGDTVEITATADHADEYRVIRILDQEVLVTGTNNVLQFTAMPNVAYQVQVRRTGGNWTDQGCTFQLNLMRPTADDPAEQPLPPRYIFIPFVSR